MGHTDPDASKQEDEESSHGPVLTQEDLDEWDLEDVRTLQVLQTHKLMDPRVSAEIKACRELVVMRTPEELLALVEEWILVDMPCSLEEFDLRGGSAARYLSTQEQDLREAAEDEKEEEEKRRKNTRRPRGELCIVEGAETIHTQLVIPKGIPTARVRTTVLQIILVYGFLRPGSRESLIGKGHSEREVRRTVIGKLKSILGLAGGPAIEAFNDGIQLLRRHGILKESRGRIGLDISERTNALAVSCLQFRSANAT